LTLVIALGLSFLLNNEDYVVLYDQLTATETSEILAQLQEMEVDVQLDSTGKITVPKKDENRVRMALATAGYPKSGLSYYLIEKGSGMLTTDYERQQYVNMQLQERIAASIKTLDGVKDAIVTITMPEENVFYLQEKDPPSASVIIHMQSGQTLVESQILGIQNLVVKSVAGLTKENVAITDSGGNDLTGGILASSEEFTKISITREIENDIRKKVLSVLEGPYDRSRLRVSVTAVVDTDNVFTEETRYTPSPEGEGNTGVVSQETRSEESSSSTQTDGGVPGTSTNSEVPVYPVTGGTGESTYSSSSESTSYMVSQTISQFQKQGARIESVSIGIAIDKNAFEPGEQERITRLVSHAVGVDSELIAVENFSFHSPDVAVTGPPPEEEGIDRKWIYIGIGAAVLLAVIAFVVVTLLRKKRRDEEVEEMELPTGEEALGVLFGEGEPPPITPVKDVRKEQIREFAMSNPEIAAQMIRSWLRAEDEE